MDISSSTYDCLLDNIHSLFDNKTTTTRDIRVKSSSVNQTFDYTTVSDYSPFLSCSSPFSPSFTFPSSSIFSVPLSPVSPESPLTLCS